MQDAPGEAAKLLEQIPVESTATFLNHVPVKDSATLLLQVSVSSAAHILLQMEKPLVGDIFALFNPNQISALLRPLEKEPQAELLKLLPERRAQACLKLLHYASNCIGAFANTDVPVFANNLTVEECLLRLKKQEFNDANFIFVNDDEGRYLGSVTLFKLLRQNSRNKIAVLPFLGSVQLSGLTPLITAIGIDIWKQHEFVAVVDSRNYFIGSLTHLALRKALAGDHLQESPPAPLFNELGNAFSASLTGLLEVFDKPAT